MPETIQAPAPQAHEEMPRTRISRGRLLAFGVFVLSSLAFLYFVLPKIVGLQHTWNRLQQGNGWWLGIAACLEFGVFVSYVSLFRTVFVRGSTRIDWRESWQINLAGLAATRLFAAGGAGGIALTAWALRRSGLDRRTVACRMIAFLVLLYGVFMATLVIDGAALYFGVFSGPAPVGVTLVPAIFGACVIAIFVAMSLLPGDFERLVARWSGKGGRLARLAKRAAAAPATAATGVRTAIGLIRDGNLYLLAAITYWGFDISVLWACFHAFGHAPHKSVIVISYFVGMLGNVLPLPGGIGGVDGGMIGAFTAFGVPVELSIVSVLAYRAFAFWLPTLPGAVAYLRLRSTVHRWTAATAA